MRQEKRNQKKNWRKMKIFSEKYKPKLFSWKKAFKRKKGKHTTTGLLILQIAVINNERLASTLKTNYNTREIPEMANKLTKHQNTHKSNSSVLPVTVSISKRLKQTRSSYNV